LKWLCFKVWIVHELDCIRSVATWVKDSNSDLLSSVYVHESLAKTMFALHMAPWKQNMWFQFQVFKFTYTHTYTPYFQPHKMHSLPEKVPRNHALSEHQKNKFRKEFKKITCLSLITGCVYKTYLKRWEIWYVIACEHSVYQI
jgi:hypothetical protein